VNSNVDDIRQSDQLHSVSSKIIVQKMIRSIEALSR
jgi:hypothetical protein